MGRVAVLGSTGMLGSTLTRVLESEFSNLIEFNRAGISITNRNKAIKFDAILKNDFERVILSENVEYIVNAVGIIKHLIHDSSQKDQILAKIINSEFPSVLNRLAVQNNIKVIQIGTDCVFSGLRGRYSENDPLEPHDVYSQSKIEGEKLSPDSMIIRASIIGKELRGFNSLLSWVLSHPRGSEIQGYSDHFWNGVTTLQFAEIVRGIIKTNSFLREKMHLVPEDTVSKYQLVKLIAEKFGRGDLKVRLSQSSAPADRTLITVNPSRNLQLWRQGGYDLIPTINQMVTSYETWVTQNVASQKQEIM